jgi:hypothetical protein
VDFNPSTKVDYRLPNTYLYDGYVAKLSNTGSLVWATSLGGASVQDLAVDAAGSAYVVGTFRPTFQPASGVSITSNGLEDIFVTKLTSAGQVDWYVTLGGTGGDLGTAICVDAAGSIYVAGSFRATVDFDPDPLAVHELTNPAYADMFRLKLRQS